MLRPDDSVLDNFSVVPVSCLVAHLSQFVCIVHLFSPEGLGGGGGGAAGFYGGFGQPDDFSMGSRGIAI